MKLRVVKTILWFLSGLALTVVLARIIHGPGSVTVLTDLLPWGLWKGGGVVSLVAIGGAGFTLAMFVFIFQWESYKPLVRGAVLLGLLCYSSVGTGLTFDIGIWWRIVYPVWNWQIHSVLFEVAWCIMLYLVVLTFEFSHTVLERYRWTRALHTLEKFTLVFVIAGIGLSTLHQSSLGTLFLATPFRLHPLWHTDLLPLLFFITSMGIGCLTISLVTLAVHWLYNAEPPMRAISGLGRISAYLLVTYLVLRFAQIVVSGEGGYLVERSWDTANFWIETLLSAAIPVVFLFQKTYRDSKTAMFWIAACATVGMSLNRVNVAGLATLSLTRSIYFPAWTEWAVTLGILSAAALVYLFAVEYFHLFENVSKTNVTESYEPGHLDHTDWAALYFGSQRFGEMQVYSLAFVLAIALSFGLLSDDAVYGVGPVATPTTNARVVEVTKAPAVDGAGTRFVIEPNSGGNGTLADVLMIDGNRNGRYVLFDHEHHQVTLSESSSSDSSCVLCHHMNKPFDRGTRCYECHTDMYLPVDLFDHDYHMGKLGGNEGCSRCHQDPQQLKIRENTPDCLECHKGMRPEGSRVNVTDPLKRYLASGYMDAMHELCIDCHEEMQPGLAQPKENFTSCTNCHRGLPPLDDEVWEKLQ
jgi:Ni/Fe-hydrogenase subunit HybB-like protein